MNNSTPTGDDLFISVQMQQMMAEIAQLRGELADLKSRSIPISQPQPPLPVNRAKTTSRRKALGRLGGGLVAAGLGTSLSLIPVVAANQEGNSTGQALPEGSSKITPNAIGDGSLTQTMSGFSFKPYSSNTLYGSDYPNRPGSLYYNGNTNSPFFYRLDLPQDAKITSVTFFYDVPNGYPNAISFDLTVYNPSTKTRTSLFPAGKITGTYGSSITGTPSAGTNVVDNATYCYELAVTFNYSTSNIYFNGATITYDNIVGRFQAQ